MYGPCVPYPTIAVMMRGPRSMAGLMAKPAHGSPRQFVKRGRRKGTGLLLVPRYVPVCIPKAAPPPRMTTKMAKGMRLRCNPLLRRSETENTIKMKMKVLTNWSGR